MPRKVREIIADYRRAGFTIVVSGGKGSHRKAIHPLVPGAATIAGHEGADAKPYQEAELREKLRLLAEAKRKRP
jgi:predicted RNA binding protein YcfA (HicA-like mRNA interferase family)